ncbi:hypothetical protein Pedsa_1926 [Pseudopedobacter saltans DSM 12145]|uniref:DUF4595 domain-containing protein n=1 Tax=Pseudopedobacter saltans (strain ATCC 51119 / DSM 12145 / JCM 21818 / CCUG 39354 / LMG 10337 / NBRC 100064 / NCIMB 13643) TaxID=762903 RepID=F0S9C9_PSESL|nr:hypothetical protein [Pseudopedobacter saltans]ADY52479.1 hypothetical protein Pedsa_1926 [Pseudopedobacter saltans DSM 12145]
MRKIILAVCAIFMFSCRQDDSVMTPVGIGSGNGAHCLITKYTYSDGEIRSIKYDENSMLIEDISSEGESHYLTKENPKQFLYFKGRKSSDKKMVSRIYMTDFGSVQKEVAVHIDVDGKTIIEDANQVDIYHYNDKKLLTRIEKGYGDDKGIIDLTYDNKDRLNHAVIKDPASGFVLFEFTNFKYLDRKKEDNFCDLGFTDSYNLNLIPCLRNAYMTSYTLKTMPDLGEIDLGEIGIEIGIGLDAVYTNDFKFDGSKLTSIRSTLTAMGQQDSGTANVEVSCK